MSEGNQRRLTTIVAADIAGFSRLVGIDEEGTLAAQRRYRTELIEPLLAEHHGRIANTAGDSFLFEFPSAVEAVRCSMAVQDGVAERNRNVAADRRIEFRIGINVGDVIAQGDDLLGDGVNIAARLENLCEPGGVILSDDAYRQVRDRLEIDWEDGGEREVKNIARPIRVWIWSPLGSAAEVPMTADPPLPLPDKPSIVVLPFNNMSGDPEQEFLADGLAEDITTLLSNLRWLFVVARYSAFTYKGQVVNITDVGRDLGVRYVLEGSVRKAGKRIRVTAQPIDAADGNHIWAERYDRVIEDIFEIQDDITRNIVGMLETEIASVEQVASLQRPANLDAWTAYQRGMSGLANSYDPAELGQSIADFETAVSLDPKFAAAHAGLAVSQILFAFWSKIDDENRRDLLAKALDIAKLAVRLDDRDAWPYAALARAYLFNGDIAAARQAVERALALNRNSFQVLYAAAIVATSTSDAEHALSLLDEVGRISPRSPFDLVLKPYLSSTAYLTLGWQTHDLVHFEAAFDASEQAAKQTPGVLPRINRLAAAQCLNRTEDAEAFLSDIRTNYPDMTVESYRKLLEQVDNHAFNDWLFGVLVEAGLPEK